MLAAFTPSAWARAVVIVIASIYLSGCPDDGGRYADIRLLNVSPDYRSLDLYVTAAGSGDDMMKIQNVAFETLSDYSNAGAYFYDVKLKGKGVSGTLQTLGGEKQGDGAHLTYVAFGSSGNLDVMRINDDHTVPNDDITKLQVFNASEAGTLDVYLTDDFFALDDSEPVFGDLAPGESSGIAYLDSRTYRLRVVGTGDTSDLRLDLPEVPLAGRQVLSVILTATPGDVSVGAIFLPQRGELAIEHNAKAHIRAAAVVATGVNAANQRVTWLTGKTSPR